MRVLTIPHVVVAAVVLLLGAPMTLSQEPNPIPPTFKAIYPQASQAQAQVEEAMKLAAQQHKRVILDFGTNNCPDCQALGSFFGDRVNHDQIGEHFLLVHVNVGQSTENLGIAQRFHADVKGGIPVLSVIDGAGQVKGTDLEFRRARNRSANDLTVFLNKARQ